ncbi:MAG: alpha-1,4-glucan--maltose-1-phosphate maltosyltransferase, partial [Kineosporiaceae bacterium]
GSEEYLDSEKYQYRPRDWASYAPGGFNEQRSIARYVTRLNRIRRDHPALHYLRNIAFHHVDDDSVICYSRRLDAAHSPTGQDDTILVVVNLDPHGTRETTVHLDMPALGMDWADSFTVHDLLSDQSFRWWENNYVRLDPHDQPAHVMVIRRVP